MSDDTPNLCAGVEALRTPDERFDGLAGWPYAPRYAFTADGLRVAYVEEGPPEGAPVLLLHGEPTWGYLYRHVMRVLLADGLRVVVPDLVGFGRSDKPVDGGALSYAGHVEWMRSVLFDALDLHDITLVCQDWGGLIGLRLVAEHPERFARVVAANTGLPTGEASMPDAWLRFRDFVARSEELPIGFLVASGCVRGLGEAEQAAYEAPFPSGAYQAAAKAFPGLVPNSPDDPARADQEAAWAALAGFDRPFLCAFSDSDPVTRGADARMRARIPGAAGVAHQSIEGAGHFLQEDAGEALGRVVADFVLSRGAFATPA